jgi:transposase
MSAHGHTVLHLPLNHPNLNPIEFVWADVKQSVGAENVSFNLDEVSKKCGRWFMEFGTENWKKSLRPHRKAGIRENTTENYHPTF